MPKRYDVCIIIPTFRRPGLIWKTVSSVARQTNLLGLTYEIIVVDNCPERSAADIVERMVEEFAVPIRYVSEPRQNISLARNAGINHSNSEFIAMIDDDERAAPDWLDRLVTTIRKFDADVLIGPTTPIFEKELPAWFEQSGHLGFDRRRDIPSGTVLGSAPSGNSLMRSATCVADNNRFDPELGRSTGHDTEFFMHLAKRMGRKIVWCNEAIVEEFIPESRLSIRYLMRRKLSNNQAFVLVSVRYSDHPIRTAAYLMFVVGCTQIAIWLLPSLVLAPFQTPYSVRAKTNLMRGVGKLFWSRRFRFNFY